MNEVITLVLSLLWTREAPNTQAIYANEYKQLYSICNTHNIAVIDINGDTLKNYTNNKRQTISSIDARNPLNILVFYQDGATIDILDNSLNVLNKVNLIQKGYNQVVAIARSRDNAIWIYDASSDMLYKTNEQGEAIQESISIRSFSDHQWYIHQIIENNQYIGLVDSIQGVMLFDLFGNYSHSIKESGITQAQFMDNILFYSKNQKLYAIPTDTWNTIGIEISKPITHFYFSAQHLWLLHDNQLSLYTFK